MLHSVNIKYLGNHAKRLASVSELKEGELYVIGRGADAFFGFRMPPEEEVTRGEDDVYMQDIKTYVATLRECGKEIESEKTDEERLLHITDFVDADILGIFNPSEGSRLRKVLEDNLAPVTQ